MKAGQMRICLLEPYFGGSHRRWAEGLRDHSRHEIEILELPARHWKWRMHGAAVSFAEQLADSGRAYDLVLATDMMDVAAFAGLLAGRGTPCRIATYFHENQLTYPLSERERGRGDRNDLRYGFINYTSALASGLSLFNSDFHREAFLSALPAMLGHFPDFRNEGTLERIEARAHTLHLGMNLGDLDRYGNLEKRGKEKKGPLILWNHRWEYDKRPERFLEILYALEARDHLFEVALLGARGPKAARLLAEARERLGEKIVTDSPAESFADYAAWLWRSDIQLVTAIQDFFGGSVVEAAYCGCHPVLPRGLAYGDHVREDFLFYEGKTEALERLERLIISGAWRQPFEMGRKLARYDWRNCIGSYDTVLEGA